jgi:hypothetical protein
VFFRFLHRVFAASCARRAFPSGALNPAIPEDAQEITFPLTSVIVTMVLLKVD